MNWEIIDTDMDDLRINVSYSTDSEMDWVNVYSSNSTTGDYQFIPLGDIEEIMVKIVVDDDKQKVVAKRSIGLTISDPTTEPTEVTEPETNETSPESDDEASFGFIEITLITVAVAILATTQRRKNKKHK